MRPVVERLAETIGERADRVPGRAFVEREPAAEEVVGVEITQQQGRIGDRGLGAARAVAGRPRDRAGAARAHPEQAARIDPGDRAAARADAAHVD